MSVISIWDGYKYITIVQGSDAPVSDTPANNDVVRPISSNWAYDHENSSDPHPNLAPAHVIQEEGSSLAQRGKLNFTGAAISVVDNAGSDTTTVSVESVGLIPTMFSAEMRKSAPQTNLLTGAWRLITWENIIFEDLYGICDLAGDAFIVPPGCDRAIVTFNFICNNASAFNINASGIQKNATTIAQAKYDHSQAYISLPLTTGVIDVAPGDVFSAHVWPVSTSSIDSSIATKFSIVCWKSKAVVPNLQFNGALVSRITSNFDIGTATYNNIQFNSEIYDTKNFFDIADPTKLVVPLGVTHVRVKGAVRLATTGSGEHLLTITKNGSSSYVGVNQFRDNDPTTDQQYQVSTAVLEVVAGDYFQLEMYSGNGVDVMAHPWTWFSIEEVKPISVEGGAYTIEDEGTPVQQRNTINFVGNGVRVTDDGINNKTIVNIQGNEYTPIIPADFSWFNQQTSQYTQNPDGSIWMEGYATSAACNLTTLFKAAPATPYKLTVCFQPFMSGGNFAMSGIGWKDSITGKMSWFAHCSHTSYVADNLLGMWNINADNLTVPNDYTQQQWPGISRMDRLWLRIEDDGTNRKWYVSPNGINWVLFHTVTRLAHLTPDQLMFGVASWSSNTIPRALFYSWKEE